MGGNRQQKLAAKAVRRKQVVSAKQQADRFASSSSGKIVAAAAGPVERCLRLADLVDAGIGHVILARRLPSGALGCGFFLVDLLCLGVKDAFFRDMVPSELDARVADLRAGGQAMVPIDPASAKKLILGAVAFAAGSGMDPAKDFRAAFKLFDGIDAEAATESFTFGRDGKALYIPGPNDSPSKMREVERRLTRARGDAWDVDLFAALPERERIAMHGVLDLLDRQSADDGPVIDHDPDDGAIVHEPASADDASRDDGGEALKPSA